MAGQDGREGCDGVEHKRPGTRGQTGLLEKTAAAASLCCIQAKPGPVDRRWRPEAAASDVEMAMMYYVRAVRARRIRVARLSRDRIFFQSSASNLYDMNLC